MEVGAAMLPSRRDRQEVQPDAPDSAAALAGGGIYPRMVVASGRGCAGAAVAGTAGCTLGAGPDASTGRGEDASPEERHTAALRNPAEPPPEILIQHRRGSAAGRTAAQRIAEEARRAGVRVVDIRAAAAVPGRREIHYFRAEDAGAGEHLASRFRRRWGNAWQVLASGANAAVPAHTLEIWLPHR
jgi:hypothetical protein